MAELLDVITLADAKDELRLQAATYDSSLAVFVSAVSQRLDELCGPIVVRTVTDSLNGASGSLRLSSMPVSSITTVTEYSGTTAQVLTGETNSTKSVNDYWVDTSGLLYRRSDGYSTWWPQGAGNVVVVYQAGRFATTADVSAKFRLAARIMVKHFWRYESGTGSQTFGTNDFDGVEQIATFAIPRVVAELLADEVQNTPVIG